MLRPTAILSPMIGGSRRLGAALLILAAAWFSPPLYAAQSGPDISPYLALQSLDEKVTRVGYRLGSSNAEFCPQTKMGAGFALHDIAQYQDRKAARAAFGFVRDISILSVAPGSPAAQAGLFANDGVDSIDGADPLDGLADNGKFDKDDSFGRMAHILDMWDRKLAAGPVEMKVLLPQTTDFRNITLIPTKICHSRFQLVPDRSFKASADGQTVTVSSRMVEYVNGDEELAAVLAHEMSHNILRHLERLEAAGHTEGLFGSFGRSARLTKQTEIEADRLSIWLMVNAGYDPAAAIQFWRRYGKQHGKGIFSAPTHYRYKKRIRTFEEEIAKIERAQRGPDGYAPPLLSQPFPELK